MNHIDEKTLELYVLDANEVKEQRGDIEAHLNECPGCAALQLEMAEYYSEVQKLHDERTNETSHALTLRNMIVRMPFGKLGPLQNIPATLPARLVLFVVRHYVVSSASFLALAIGTLAVLFSPKGITDRNPAYARAKDELLVAYNKDGQEVWRNHIGPKYTESNANTNPDQYLATVDVDNDGKNEILALFGPFPLPANSTLGNTIMCFSDNGTQRWKFEFHRKVTFGTERFSDDFKFRFMTVGDFARNGNYEIAAIAQHDPYWPTSVVFLDARNGTLVREFWHCGWLRTVDHRDIDGDGIEELLFTAENNSFNRAAILVLDPRYAEGYAPSTPQNTPQDVHQGLEKYYIMLPYSDLQSLATYPRPTSGGLSFRGNKLIEVKSQEEIQGESYDMMFYFDSTMKCVEVRPSDRYLLYHRRMESEGKLKVIVVERYLEELRRGVQYWDGEKFVHEPTMNKLYVEAVRKKMLP